MFLFYLIVGEREEGKVGGRDNRNRSETGVEERKKEVRQMLTLRYSISQEVHLLSCKAYTPQELCLYIMTRIY